MPPPMFSELIVSLSLGLVVPETLLEEVIKGQRGGDAATGWLRSDLNQGLVYKFLSRVALYPV